MSTLEARYRRLLGLYPAEHRRRFGDEMLAVLMSAAADGQRRPPLGESVNLLWHALWRRLGGLRQPQPDGPWAQALAVVGVVGSLSLFAVNLDTGWLPSGTAAALTLIVLFGPRWLVVPVAWVAVAINTFLVPSIETLWTLLLLGLTTAIALSARQPAREGLRLLGGRGVAMLATVALAVGGSKMTGGWTLSQIVVVLAAIAGTVVLWRRLDGPVRRRVLVILAPSAALYFLVVRNMYFFPDALFALTLAVVVAVLGFGLLKPWERLMHLLELGRKAGRES
ncbi:MAG TPA: hypothetical protein VF062_13635 [Candidatus Limnocylindrales bacterium]